jgi:hypothetical protein
MASLEELNTVSQVIPPPTSQPARPSVTTVVALTKLPNELQITNDHVIKMIQHIQMVLNGKPITPINILRVANSVFGVACNMKDLPHRLQQTVIINALDNIIDNQTDMSDLDREMLEQMLQVVIPEVLNIASDIKNNIISFKKNNDCCCVIA